MQPRLNINMPTDHVAGVYADLVSAWHTPNVFVLDFAAVVRPVHPEQTDDGKDVLQLDAQVVARVKIPPSQVFEIMKALEKQLTAWETETGKRTVPPKEPT